MYCQIVAILLSDLRAKMWYNYRLFILFIAMGVNIIENKPAVCHLRTTVDDENQKILQLKSDTVGHNWRWYFHKVFTGYPIISDTNYMSRHVLQSGFASRVITTPKSITKINLFNFVGQVSLHYLQNYIHLIV